MRLVTNSELNQKWTHAYILKLDQQRKNLDRQKMDYFKVYENY